MHHATTAALWHSSTAALYNMEHLSCNDPLPLLPQAIPTGEVDRSSDIGKEVDNKPLNRFKNILPCESSTVCVAPSTTTFIQTMTIGSNWSHLMIEQIARMVTSMLPP